jgi:hypothetical protein
MKNARTSLSPAELHVLLDREFRRRRPAICKECNVQMPFRLDKPSNGSPNWDVLRPPECPADCWRVVDQVVGELAVRYDLAAD